MGLLHSISSWFSRESAEVRQSRDDLEQRIETDLTGKEQALSATPEEGVDQLQEAIADSETTFEAIREKIEGTSAHAEALVELDDTDG
jgi:hypothetical protein